MDKTKILIADDHRMFRTGIAALLEKRTEFEIVGEAPTGDQAVNMASNIDIDIILMDINIPVKDGIIATREILENNPHIKILALSSDDRENQIIQMVNAGAMGYVLKDASIEELIQAIKTLIEGNSYFSKSVSSKLFARLEKDKRPVYGGGKNINGHRITQREYEILQFVFEELSNKEIAARLFISPRTVETHKRNLIKKLQVKNTVGLIKYYLDHVSKLENQQAQ